MEAIVFFVCVVLFSSLINSTFGFGFALLCMPLLSLRIDLKILGPLVPLLFVVGSTIIIIRSWKDIDFKSIFPLIIGATLTVPFGVYLGKYGPEIIIKIVLCFVIILFSLYNIFAPKLPKLESDKWAPFFGGLSGLFGGAYNISGPPAIIYGALRQWTPPVFRVSLQCYFLYVTFIVIGSHIYLGSYNNPLIGWYFLCAFPIMILAEPIGKKINSSIKDPVKFGRHVYLLMLLSGVLLVLKAFEMC